MTPLRITCVTLEMGCGGAQRVMQSLTGHLVAAGHRLTLVQLDGSVPDFFAVDPRVHRPPPLANGRDGFHPLDLAGRWRWFATLRRQLLAAAPEVVIVFQEVPSIEVLLALAGTGVPVIACEHNEPRWYPIPRRWQVLRRLLYPRARVVVVLNEAIADWSRSIVPPWPSVTIANPLEPAPPAQPAPAGWLGPRTLMAVGRLVPQKGFDLLIAAFVRIAADHPQWQLTILGDGPERAALDAQVSASGLAARIRLVGAVAEPRAYLGQADLFVMPSRFEGFGVALVEAMDAGLAVVSFACESGPPAILEHGVDGVLVPPGDVPALAAALAALMADDDRRARLGAAARRAAGRYAPEAVMARWQALLEEVGGGGSGLSAVGPGER